MISWIQKYFQHHFRAIFAVLLVLIIIAFVFTIGASPGIGRGDRRVVERYFFEHNLSRPEDRERLFGDAELSAGLQMGMLRGFDSEQIQSYAFQRGAALHLASEWHIPKPGAAEISDRIKELRMFSGPNGEFDPKAYDTFRTNLKSDPRGPTEADVARVIGDDIRVEKVHQLLSGPGYVLPGDVKNQLVRADTNWTLALATADYAGFKPEIKPSDADLAKFFDENSFRYEIPPRIATTCVDFQTTNYLAGVNVTEAEVRAFYDSNPARFPKPPQNNPANPLAPNTPAPSNPDADYAAVRTQVEAALRLERAQKLAVKAASDFALALFEAKISSESALDPFLAAQKITAKPLAPFTREAGPTELGGSPEVAAEAFKLSKERFSSEPISTPNGAVVLFFKDLEPARKPLLAEVREKVLADYVENEKRKRFVELGKTIKDRVAARVKTSEAFEPAVAAAAGDVGLKVETKKVGPFTLRTRPQDLDYSALGTLERLGKGEVSDMVVEADKGIFVYAAEKQLPDLSESNPRFTETRNQLASYTARMGATAYISELVEKELKRGEPKAE